MSSNRIFNSLQEPGYLELQGVNGYSKGFVLGFFPQRRVPIRANPYPIHSCLFLFILHRIQSHLTGMVHECTTLQLEWAAIKSGACAIDFLIKSKGGGSGGGVAVSRVLQWKQFICLSSRAGCSTCTCMQPETEGNGSWLKDSTGRTGYYKA